MVICYSGGGSQVANERLLKALRDDGLVDCKISLGNDCLAPIFTAFKNGGVVLISGTGSNCILVNPIDESCKLKSLDQINISNSGGWGNLLGDEGSAYWIAQKAIKYLIDVNDNFLEIDDDVTELEKLIFEHFQVKSLSELLPHFYSDFKKDFIASLTLKLSIASESNPLFRSFFEEAGYQLARHIVAIQPKVSKKLINCPKGLPIVCAGSVYKSWNLIKPGFIQCLRDYRHRCADLKKINLVKIEDHSAVGAVLLAARIYNSDLDFLKTFDYASLTSQLDQIDVDSIVVHKNYTLNLNYFTSYIKGILW